jgi:hypothetical protein
VDSADAELAIYRSDDKYRVTWRWHGSENSQAFAPPAELYALASHARPRHASRMFSPSCNSLTLRPRMTDSSDRTGQAESCL